MIAVHSQNQCIFAEKRAYAIAIHNAHCFVCPGSSEASNRLFVCENEIKIILLLSLLKYVVCCSRYGANKAKRRRRRKKTICIIIITRRQIVYPREYESIEHEHVIALC